MADSTEEEKKKRKRKIKNVQASASVQKEKSKTLKRIPVVDSINDAIEKQEESWKNNKKLSKKMKTISDNLELYVEFPTAILTPIFLVLTILLWPTGIAGIVFGSLLIMNYMLNKVVSETWKDEFKDLSKTVVEVIEAKESIEAEAEKNKQEFQLTDKKINTPEIITAPTQSKKTNQTNEQSL